MIPQAQQSVAALRRFAQPREALQRCELCSAPLVGQHQHLVDPASRQLLCACDACALLFSERTQAKYVRVPRTARALTDFRLTDAQWNALLVPIGLAFFFYSSPAGKTVAVYPSPAGPTESLLDAQAWDQIVHDNPVLREMEPDTQSLLANRMGPSREYYVAPIDQCYKLVGLVRAHWQGLSGGTAVWREIDRFFESLTR